MNKKVFISGSISIKSIPNTVKDRLNIIIEKNISVLIGDADGIDIEIQNFMKARNYFNVTVYHIDDKNIRNCASKKFNFKLVNVTDDSKKKERERQEFKDKEMTEDCDYGLVIWNEKSKGSYKNILRLIDSKKGIRVFSTKQNIFLSEKSITKLNITYLFRLSNGFTASEAIKELEERDILNFKSPKKLNKFLLDKKIIFKNFKEENKKNDKYYYAPMKGFENLVIVKHNKTGIDSTYSLEMIDYIEKIIRTESIF